MISSRRKAHRVIVTAMAVLLPLLAVASLVLRP